MARRKKKRIKGLRDLDFGRPKLEVSSETKRGIIIVLLLTFGILSILSLFDLAGTLGVYLNTFLKYLFGITRWYLPVLFILVGYFLLRPAKYEFKTSNIVGLIIFIFSFNGLIHLIFHSHNLVLDAKAGMGSGYSGIVLSWPFYKLMGFWAGLVVLLAITVIGFILLFETYIVNLIEKRRELVEEGEDEEDEEIEESQLSLFGKFRHALVERRIKKIQAEREKISEALEEPDQGELEFTRKEVEIEQAGGEEENIEESEEEEEEIEEPEVKELNRGVIKFKRTRIDLPVDLLDGRTTTPKGGDLKANKMIIEKTLKNFGIRVEMGEAQVGPTVTQYTLKPAEGVKLSRITSLSDNLALALASHPIRIEAPIPGKSLVGVEVPNQSKAIVPLKDILTSLEFKNRGSNLTLTLGKDVMGKPWLAQLEKMPHLLIAGATNSGKSVCINSVIVSLLYQNGPGDLKFIMVDPKRVELPVYNGIPHLLTPVITDTKKTVNALRWTIKEMEKRFDLLAEARHRNIESYNNSTEDKMPYIVFVIDELADLMIASGPEVEGAIVRLAQMSRAVGIHLILATQRPSVDVLTGLIKANIPARVAFSVTSLVDSRTILDQSGAEKLLGKGDMLYVSADMSKPKRLQGAFASDDEIKRVIEYLKDQANPEYIEEVVEKQQMGMGEMPAFSGGDGGDDGDPLLGEAKEVITRAKKASASLLQRRLRIGYARAARILDLLEEQGVIGPGDGAKPREVLINTFSDDTIKDQADDASDYEEPEVDDEDDESDEEEEKF